MKIFWKAQLLEMAETHKFFAKAGADHDAAIGNWLRVFFAEIWALCPKNALQNALKNLS